MAHSDPEVRWMPWLGTVVDNHSVFSNFGAMGGAAGLAYSLRQIRLYLQYRERMAFARHVFDQTGSTDGLHGLAELAQAERSVRDEHRGPGEDESSAAA